MTTTEGCPKCRGGGLLPIPGQKIPCDHIVTTPGGRLTPERETVLRYVFEDDRSVGEIFAELDTVRRERDEARKDADRWEWFADGADREITDNGDNSFVRYVGPWIVAEYKHDPEDGDYLLPSTSYEWIDAAMAKDGDA